MLKIALEAVSAFLSDKVRLFIIGTVLGFSLGLAGYHVALSCKAKEPECSCNECKNGCCYECGCCKGCQGKK